MNPAILKQLAIWRDDPVAFVRDCIEVEPSDQQMELLVSFRPGGKKKISVRSGHGTGKDASACWVILWYMATRFNAKIVCIAPTAHQLEDILWSELGKWLQKSKLKDDFVKLQKKFFHKEHPDTWWCRTVSPAAKSSAEEQAETIAGFHGDHLLIICDEASGIVDPLYTAIEGALTQEDNWLLLIGNMTRNTGYFYDSHFHPQLSEAWLRLHWRSDASSNVKQSYCEYMAIKYGRDSNVYRIRVEGNPPISDSRTLIPLDWARQCIANEKIATTDDDVLYLGADIARFGDDASVIMPRKGYKIYPWDTLQSVDLMVVSDRISVMMDLHEAEGVAIDEIGLGAGVVDYLRRQAGRNAYKVSGVNVTHRASKPEVYKRLRDELWWKVRENCRMGLYNFPDIKNVDGLSIGEELANELASVYYDIDKASGLIVIESKLDMKRRGLASPNIADALCLTEYFNTTAQAVWRRPAKELKRRRKLPGEQVTSSRNTWMTV